MKSFFAVILIFLYSCHSTHTETEDLDSGPIQPNAPYLWNGGFPKSLGISEDFSNDDATKIQTMSTKWEQAQLYKRNFFSFGSRIHNINAPDLKSLNDNTLGIYKVTDWPSELPSSALAVTQLYGRRYNIGTANEFVSISHADIMVNYDNYQFSSSSYDLNTVILHELGHFLGFLHSPVDLGRSVSVMYPSIGMHEIKTSPTSYDINELIKKYKIDAMNEEMDPENQEEDGLETTTILETFPE